MINQNTTFENSENQFAIAFKELKLGKLLNKSRTRKAQGASAYSVFQFLLLLVFQGKTCSDSYTLSIRKKLTQRILTIGF